MKDSKRGLSLKSQLIVLTVLFYSSCALKGTSSSCSTGTAQLTVTDTTISRDCGCAEGSGTFATGSTNFVCTLPLNTVLYFNFNTQMSHNFQFGNGITPVIYTPDVSSTTQAMTFRATSSGITFSDLGGTAITGVFVITAN